MTITAPLVPQHESITPRPTIYSFLRARSTASRVYAVSLENAFLLRPHPPRNRDGTVWFTFQLAFYRFVNRKSRRRRRRQFQRIVIAFVVLLKTLLIRCTFRVRFRAPSHRVHIIAFDSGHTFRTKPALCILHLICVYDYVRLVTWYNITICKILQIVGFYSDLFSGVRGRGTIF